MPFTEALATIQSNSQCLVGTEVIELKESLGRVLAQDVFAAIDLPPAANSAMDGYVMR